MLGISHIHVHMKPFTSMMSYTWYMFGIYHWYMWYIFAWWTVQGKWSWVPRPVTLAGQTARSESESGAGWVCASYGGKGARCHTRSFEWDTSSVQFLRNETVVSMDQAPRGGPSSSPRREGAVQTCNRVQVDSRGTDRHNQVDQVNWLQVRRRGFSTGMEHRAIAAKLRYVLSEVNM
jgi:hypothetical protein